MNPYKKMYCKTIFFLVIYATLALESFGKNEKANQGN